MDRVCVLTPQWFNKPKFHVLLHLPDHIRRFGPAMLFATEGFESFNAVIREASVHSNRHAPSRDIAAQMARRNRVRHLLSGGLFLLQPSKSNARAKKTPTRNESSAGGERETLSISPWSELSPEDLDRSRWRSASTDPRQLLENGAFGMRVLDLPDPPHDEAMQAGTSAISLRRFASLLYLRRCMLSSLGHRLTVAQDTARMRWCGKSLTHALYRSIQVMRDCRTQRWEYGKGRRLGAILHVSGRQEATKGRPYRGDSSGLSSIVRSLSGAESPLHSASDFWRCSRVLPHATHRASQPSVCRSHPCRRE